jgi:hypothetical protein
MSSSSGADIDVGEVSFSDQALTSDEERLHVLIDANVLLVVLAAVVPPDEEGALGSSPPLSFGIWSKNDATMYNALGIRNAVDGVSDDDSPCGSVERDSGIASAAFFRAFLI